MTPAYLGIPHDQTADDSVNSVDQRPRRMHLQAAMTHLGVPAEHVALDWDVDSSYVSRVLSGEKPWSTAVEAKIALLPLELRAAMAEEACKDVGIVTGTLASLIHLLHAMMGVLATEQRRLPARTQRQAKADLDALPAQKQAK